MYSQKDSCFFPHRLGEEIEQGCVIFNDNIKFFRPVWRQNGCKCWSWWVDFLRILVQDISKLTTPFAKKIWTLPLSLTPPRLRIREERRGKKQLGIKFQNLTENFKILSSTRFRLLCSTPYSLAKIFQIIQAIQHPKIHCGSLLLLLIGRRV